MIGWISSTATRSGRETISHQILCESRPSLRYKRLASQSHGNSRPPQNPWVTYFVTREEDSTALTEIRTIHWGSIEPPAVTTLVVAALARLICSSR